MSVGRTFQTEVVVVGGGGAGLAAALAAAESGAEVTVLEVRQQTGGTTRFPAGIFAAESSLQRAMGINLSRQEIFSGMMEFSHYKSNAKLTQAIIDKSPSTVDWLKGHGVEFVTATSPFPGGVPTWHLINGAGAALVKALDENARDRGTIIHRNTAVKHLVREDNRVVGAVASMSGSETEIRGRAVILATGGFGSNRDWVRRHLGFEVGVDLFGMDLGLTGDGQRMAWEVGASSTEMISQTEFDLVGPGLSKTQLRLLPCQPYLWVNLQGERLGNEERITRLSNYGGNVLALQPKKQAFLLFDDDTRACLEDVGLDVLGPPFKGVGHCLVELNEQIRKAQTAGNRNVFVAETVQGLASATGICPDGLLETLSLYNQLADAKIDEQFGKDPRFLHPIRKQPFYAFRINATTLGTLGGVKINAKTQVVDNQGKPIQGLYAVGNIAGGMYGDTYSMVFPGMTLGFAINSGRIAGEDAVRYTVL